MEATINGYRSGNIRLESGEMATRYHIKFKEPEARTLAGKPVSVDGIQGFGGLDDGTGELVVTITPELHTPRNGETEPDRIRVKALAAKKGQKVELS